MFILILRDKSVISDGILEKGVIDNFMSVFDIQDGCNYLKKRIFRITERMGGWCKKSS